MYSEKSDSIIKETLKSVCCSNGWSYGVFWGFDETNSLLLTLKDAYSEEQMGALIDNMLLQVHVLGGGVIGQAAFTKSHQWIYSDSHHQMENSLGSFESLEIFQDDSEFYFQFSMGIKTIALISVEPWGVVQLGSTQKIHESKDFADQVKQLFTKMDQHQEPKFLENEPILDSNFHHEGFMEENHSLIFPSQSFPSTSEFLLDSGNFFDCSATQALSNNNSDCSVLTSSWPNFSSGLKKNVPFFEDMTNNQDFTSLLDPTDYKSAQKPSGLLTLEELIQENEFSDSISKSCLTDDLSQWFSHQPSTINDLPFPTNSIQSSLTDLAFKFNQEPKNSRLGFESGLKKPQSWNETLIPFTSIDDLKNFSTNNSKVGTSNTLFSKLGLDRILDGIGSTSTSSCSFSKSRFEDQSSSAPKRRKIDNYSWSHNEQVKKFEGLPLYEPEMRNNSEVSKNEEGFLKEPAKTGKKKAKPGTKPRPKDRQMIQDRLAELRELIPNGEKMSIDRLLERTIRHLSYMHCLAKHAESLKQIDQAKSRGVQKDQSSGVTWACEVGDENMVCPLKVEDLITPGQMLIEILCEEQGFFLEIVEIIREFGLVILKGEMEVRETKIWAHFIVESEGTRRVTRHEIFSSLIHLLQMTGQNANDQFDNVISSGVPLFENYQPAVSFPVNLGDTLQCANL